MKQIAKSPEWYTPQINFERGFVEQFNNYNDPGLLPGLFFDPENGSNMFLRNDG
jgi:hypothetical protein